MSWPSAGGRRGRVLASRTAARPTSPTRTRWPWIPSAGSTRSITTPPELRSAFPDLRVESTAPPLVRGAQACVPWRALGSHRGDLGPMLPASERFVTLHGVHVIELTDGAVRRARGFFDLYDAATQLGLLPARGGLGETALLLLRGFGLRRRPG